MTTPTTRSLFDDEPEPAFALTPTLAQRQPTTAAEKEFHRLAELIEAARERMKQWQGYLLRYQQRVAAELMPLQARLQQGQRLTVLLIDDLLSDSAPGRRVARGQRSKLRHLLLELLEVLLSRGADPELEALHDKYSEVSHEELGKSHLDLTQEMLKEVFGIDVGDDHGATSAEELLARAESEVRAQMEREAQQAETRRASRKPGSARARAAKAEAENAERERAAREIGQSLREVYRKLVSALHPDREPDAQARERKTALMQRVNQAYEANDLLTLLGLQLEIEQIDAAHLSTVPPQRLAHYNAILREQLAGIESAIERFIEPFREGLGRPGRSALSPDFVDRRLSADIAELKLAVRSIEHDRAALLEPQSRAEVLRHYRPAKREFDESVEFERLLDSLRAAPPPQRRGGRRRR
jgi:hypothetical protein